MVGTPVTPASKMIQRTPSTTPGGGTRVREEKILVTVRNPNQERPATSYKFDKVFDPSCSTLKVYEEGAKNVAFGKTYTMRGITENAVTDIFEHIKNTQERAFVLKVSALEIYNENVIDLLNRESGHLRLLDDPERGIIVEKLVEEVVKDINHLRHLIGICEAQRQVGETSLNDKSSRSHQIIRLTVESSLREKSGCVKSFLASLNLVDLAGSERASQTNADGARFKEGSHINRSLLTLTTVIRKLSGGKRSGHVPYRDSKLTRILQPSLGGNARTAIICTMSPALSHVEQTRNTLSFATSAKEVTNNAQINMVVSDKKLVKHLQKEVERLEAELRSPEPSSASYLQSLLIEKNLQIEQMEREMKELKRQRDHAQSQLEQEKTARKEQKGTNQYGPSGQVARCLSFPVEKGQSVTSTDPSMLVQEIRKLEQRQRQLGEEANRALEILHKDVASHTLGNQATAETIAKMLSDIKDMQEVSTFAGEIVNGEKVNAASLKEEITRLNSHESTIASLERKLDNVQKSIDMLVSSLATTEDTPNYKVQSKKKIFPFALSNSSSMHKHNKVPMLTSDLFWPSETTPLKSGKTGNSTPSREVTPASGSNSVNVKKMQRMFKNAAEENIRSIRAYVTELKERVAKLQYQKQLLVCQVLELEANEAETTETETMDQSPMPWHLVFDDQRKQIIMLWHLCHVSIIHRTQFYLLFRGEPGDQIYLEVELRRLTWLEQHLAELGNASPALLGDEPASSVSSSIKALRQEREYLAKRVNSKLTVDEREMLYVKWEIPPGGKQRRLQLVNKLWTDPLNMQHVKESAEIVAKLVGFCESGEHVSKEMFELNFANPCDKKTWMGWNLISNLLNL
ncbi:KINESIN-LIKE PROTEIN KIN-7B [Salix purpurea]|uniref:Kinesin-like protein n=1 Tax=Salix purpurea TaxID=77065 RepID=A0A9Q0T2L5_SALPP|nr:KINESIN-LIKE PROTEIN KIN-7B [Salix purpurea]